MRAVSKFALIEQLLMTYLGNTQTMGKLLKIHVRMGGNKITIKKLFSEMPFKGLVIKNQRTALV